MDVVSSHAATPAQTPQLAAVSAALALLALGTALTPFPYLGLLGLPLTPASAVALTALLLRVGRARYVTGWRTLAGAVLIVAGAVMLAVGGFATPYGFLVVMSPSGFTFLREVGPYHFDVPVGFLFGGSLGPIRSYSIPVLWVASATLLGLGAKWRAATSFSFAIKVIALSLMVFPLSALLFLLLSTIWPLTD